MDRVMQLIRKYYSREGAGGGGSIENIPASQIPDDTPGQPDPLDRLDITEGLPIPGEPPMAGDPLKGTETDPIQEIARQEGEKAEGEKKAEAEPEPEKPAEPTQYTEADLVKELELGDHATVKEAVEARDAKFVETITNVFKEHDMELRASTPDELAREIDALARDAKTAPDQPAKAESAPKSGDEVKVDLSNAFKVASEHLDIDDGTKILLNGVAETVIKAITDRYDGIRGALGEVQSRAETAEDRMMYAEAKTAAGDDPMPPFSEARRMLAENPKLREDALYRQRIFGDDSANAFKTVGEQWRASKTGTGMTKAQEAKAAKEASAGKRFTRQLTPGAVKETPKKIGDLPNKEFGDAIHTIPISKVFPGN
jgi:hypothetical protein